MILYGFWRSIATMRVRTGLALKGLAADELPVDLLRGDQFEESFRAVNPARAVPALVPVEGAPALFQSMAILEWLEETHPQPPFLPHDAAGRARVRGLALIAAADTHPLSVPRVRSELAQRFGADERAVQNWVQHFIMEGATSLEGHLCREAETGEFCHGNVSGLADICLFSLKAQADMFEVDLTPWPTVRRIAARCAEIEAFASSHPTRQPGAPHRHSVFP